MASGDNINGMRAQNWKALPVKQIEQAASQPHALSADQQQLFNAIVAVVKAAAHDIHGNVADDKYRYIVDLIIRRTKQSIDECDINVVNELKEALEDAKASSITEQQLESLVSQLRDDNAQKMKAAVASALADAKFDDDWQDGIVSKITDYVNEKEAARSKQLSKIEQQFQKFFNEKPEKTKEKRQGKASASSNAADKTIANSKQTTRTTPLTAQQYSQISNQLFAIGNRVFAIDKMLVEQNYQLAENMQKLASISAPSSAADKDNVTSTSAMIASAQTGIEGKLAGLAKKSPNIAMTVAAIGMMTMPALKTIMTIGTGMKKMLVGISSTVTRIAKAVLGGIGEKLVKALMSPGGMYAIGFIAGYVWSKWLKKIWSWLKDKIAKFDGFIGGLNGSTLWNLLRFGLRGAMLWKLFKLEGIVKRFAGLSAGIVGTVKSLFSGVLKAIKGVASLVVKAIEGIASLVVNGTKGIWNAGKGIWNAGNALFTGSKAASDAAKVAVVPAFKGAKVGRDAATGRFVSLGNKAAQKTAQKAAEKTAQKTTEKAAQAAVSKGAMKTAGKVAVKALRVLGVAAGAGLTFVMNKMELKALVAAAKDFCKANGAKDLDELLSMYGFVDENGNDITDEIHLEAQSMKNEIEMKAATSRADLAAEALNFIFPGAGLAVQIGTQALTQRMLDADKARREGNVEANKAAKQLASSLKNAYAKSAEIQQQISNLQSSRERQQAMKQRLERLQKAKALYAKLAEQENEAQQKQLEMSSGIKGLFASGDELRFWQEKEQNAKSMKRKLLEDNGFTADDMRSKASKKLGDKDSMTEEQKLAKQLAEAEIAETGNLSEDTYALYAKAFKIEGSYQQNKDRLLSTDFATVAKSFSNANASQQEAMQGISDQLQSRIDSQQQALEKLGSGNEQIIDALQKNAQSQQEVNAESLQRLKDIQASLAQQTQPAYTNNVAVVQAPASRQNAALIENNARRKIL